MMNRVVGVDGERALTFERSPRICEATALRLDRRTGLEHSWRRNVGFGRSGTCQSKTHILSDRTRLTRLVAPLAASFAPAAT